MPKPRGIWPAAATVWMRVNLPVVWLAANTVTMWAANGGVNITAVRMHQNFGGGIGIAQRHAGGQSADGFHRVQRAGFAVPCEGGDGATHFIDDVHEFAIVTESQMPWSGTGWHGGGARVRQELQRAILGIEGIDKHAVQPKIAGKREMVARVRGDEVCVGRGLANGVHSPALVLIKCIVGGNAAIRSEREGFDAAAAVVGSEQDFAGVIDADMAWAVAAGGFLIQEREVAGVAINGERADGAGVFIVKFFYAVGGVQEFFIR